MKRISLYVFMLIVLSLALQGCKKDENGNENGNGNEKAPTTPFVVTISGTISHTDHTPGQSGTVTFSRFPFSVAEFKQAREQIGGEPHGAAALQIMASEMWRRNNQRGKECIDLNNTNTNVSSSVVNRLTDVYRASTQRPYQMAAYLKGASPENGYNPTKPYTVELRVAAGRPYNHSTDYQATVIPLEVISYGHDSGSVPVSVLKTNRPGEASEGKYFIVFECSSLYLQCKAVSFSAPFNGLD